MGRQVALSLLIYNNYDIPTKPIPISPKLPIDISFDRNDQILSKQKILQELLSNKNFLMDLDEESSGSDSNPSDDNLEAIELEAIIKFSSTMKILESRKKQLQDLNKSRPLSTYQNHIKKALSVPRKGKCNLCGEYLALGHACTGKSRHSRNPSTISRSTTQVYINASGKKVRDQATQTSKPEDGKLASPNNSIRNTIAKTFHFNTKNKTSDDLPSSSRLWHNKPLPNLKKLANVKYSN